MMEKKWQYHSDRLNDNFIGMNEGPRYPAPLPPRWEPDSSHWGLWHMISFSMVRDDVGVAVFRRLIVEVEEEEEECDPNISWG